MVLIISAGIFVYWQGKEKDEIKAEEQGGIEKMADILLIVANDFQDAELDGTKSALENAGFSTEIASFIKSPRSMQGKIINSDLLLKDVNVSKYKAIAFIGGPGAEAYFNDTTALGIAKKSFEQGKIVAAICIAPVILANAGILKGKNATVWDSGSGEIINKIEAKGAIFQNQAVVQDGRSITANDPSAAKKFGEAIARALK
jgi:protease I